MRQVFADGRGNHPFPQKKRTQSEIHFHAQIVRDVFSFGAKQLPFIFPPPDSLLMFIYSDRFLHGIRPRKVQLTIVLVAHQRPIEWIAAPFRAPAHYLGAIKHITMPQNKIAPL